MHDQVLATSYSSLRIKLAFTKMNSPVATCMIDSFELQNQRKDLSEKVWRL